MEDNRRPPTLDEVLARCRADILRVRLDIPELEQMAGKPAPAQPISTPEKPEPKAPAGLAQVLRRMLGF